MYLGAAIALSGATIYYQSLSLVAFVALFACSATQLTDGRSAMKRIVSHLACAMAAAAVLDVGAASANEIKVFSSHAFSHAWAELKPQFEARGHKLTLVFGTSGMISKLISASEGGDVILSTTPGIDSLIKAGKIVAGSSTPIASCGVGISVRKGAPKPDISTVGGLRQSLLTAKAVAYSDPAGG